MFAGWLLKITGASFPTSTFYDLQPLIPIMHAISAISKHLLADIPFTSIYVDINWSVECMHSLCPNILFRCLQGNNYNEATKSQSICSLQHKNGRKMHNMLTIQDVNYLFNVLTISIKFYAVLWHWSVCNIYLVLRVGILLSWSESGTEIKLE